MPHLRFFHAGPVLEVREGPNRSVSFLLHVLWSPAQADLAAIRVPRAAPRHLLQPRVSWRGRDHPDRHALVAVSEVSLAARLPLLDVRRDSRGTPPALLRELRGA